MSEESVMNHFKGGESIPIVEYASLEDLAKDLNLQQIQQKMHVLPKEAYTSQRWFEHEQKMIFSRTWQFAGFREDISEPGQYISVQAGLNNIFIVMGRDYRLRAFHNLCRHRGTQLLRAVGKTQKAITCPYHDWSYDLEGNLLSIPDGDIEFSNVDKDCLGLKKASVDLWRGMLFVHPEPKAPSILEYFGEIEPYLGEHDVESLVEYPEYTVTEEIHANWKIVVENYIDHYHLARLHAGTLATYDHDNARYGFIGPHFAFWEPLAKHYLEGIEKNAPLPLILPLDRLGASVPMLFPALGLGETESSWSTFHIQPLAPNKTRVVIRSKVKDTTSWEFTKQQWASNNFWSKNVKGKYEFDKDNPDDPMTSADFMKEDIYACEQQQKSLQSPYFEVGASATFGESPVRDHQQIVLGYMLGKNMMEFKTENSSAKPMANNFLSDKKVTP